MKNKLFEKIRTGEKKPIATNFILCGMSLAMFEIHYGIDDKITSGFIFPNGVFNIATTKIYYTSNGEREYIKRYGKKYFLDEFMRV